MAEAPISLPSFESFPVHSEGENAGTRWKEYLDRFEIMLMAMGLENPARKKRYSYM